MLRTNLSSNATFHPIPGDIVTPSFSNEEIYVVIWRDLLKEDKVHEPFVLQKVTEMKFGNVGCVISVTYPVPKSNAWLMVLVNGVIGYCSITNMLKVI